MQVTLAVAALVLSVVALSGLLVATQMDRRDRDSLDRELQTRAIRASIDTDKTLTDTNPTVAATPSVVSSSGAVDRSETGDTYFRIFNQSGTLAERGIPPPGDISALRADGWSTLSLDGDPWRTYVMPLPDRDGLRLQVVMDARELEDRLAANRTLVAVVTMLATTVATILAWAIAGRLISPLRALQTGALQIPADNEVRRRLPVPDKPSEVHDLALTLNRTLDQLASSIGSIRRFTADAGHELRTPLATIGTYLEAIERNPELPNAELKRMIRAVQTEHQRMTALLEGLQTLARGDAGVLQTRDQFDVCLLAQHCVDHASKRFPETAFQFACCSTECMTVGWQDGVRLAIDNLLANAAHHGRSAGHVDVSVCSTGQGISIVVADDGPGIPAHQRERLTERFARGEHTATSGHGLGLALVEQQAHLHGGVLTLDDSPMGGLLATLTLRPGATTES